MLLPLKNRLFSTSSVSTLGMIGVRNKCSKARAYITDGMITRGSSTPFYLIFSRGRYNKKENFSGPIQTCSYHTPHYKYFRHGLILLIEDGC